MSALAESKHTYYQALYDAQTARANLDEALGHFPPDEQEQLPDVIRRAAEAVDVWLKNDIQRAMTIVNAEHGNENPSV